MVIVGRKIRSSDRVLRLSIKAENRKGKIMKVFKVLIEQEWILVFASDVRIFTSGSIAYTLLTAENESIRMIAPAKEWKNI